MLDTPTVSLFKCVFSNGESRHGSLYEIGTIVEAEDYFPSNSCGQGLHFWPTLNLARQNASLYGSRILRCDVEVSSLVPIGGKCKARRCYVVEVAEDNYPEIEDLT